MAKSLDEINREFDLNFTLITIMRLHEALQFAVERRTNANANTETKPTQSLDFFKNHLSKDQNRFGEFFSIKKGVNGKLKT